MKLKTLLLGALLAISQSIHASPLQSYPTATTPASDDWVYIQGATNSVRKLSPTYWDQLLVPTAVKTAAYTASVGDFVPVNATAGSVTVTLPTAPADKSMIAVKLVAVSGSNTCTIAAGGSDVFDVTGGSTTLTLSLLNQSKVLQYSAAGAIWYVKSGDLNLSTLDTRYFNASNLSSGTLPAARLPNPSSSTLGGIQSAASVSHQWIDSISTSGVPHFSQPAAADVTGLAASATTDTTQTNLAFDSFITRSAYFGTTGSVGANFTFLSEVAAPAPFDAVRFVYLNFSLTTPLVIGNTACAPAPTQGNDGTALTWTQMNGTTPFAATYSPGFETNSASTASITVPVATIGTANNIVPGVAYTEWVAVNSVARTDGHTLPLIQFRSWCAAGGIVGSENATYTTQYLIGCGEHTFATQPASDSTGAFVTSAPSHAMVASLTNTVWTLGFAQFRCTARGLTVACFGDSLCNGLYNTVTGVTPFNMVATAAVSTTSLPVENANYGQHSGATYSIAARALAMIPNIQADVIYISPFSPNNGTPTDESMWASWQDTLRVINVAKANGCDVILSTIAPFYVGGSPLSTGADNIRKSVNTAILKMANHGCYVLDVDSIISDGGSPAAIKSSYVSGSGDGTHWNQAGHNAVAVPMETILNSIITKRTAGY